MLNVRLALLGEIEAMGWSESYLDREVVSDLAWSPASVPAAVGAPSADDAARADAAHPVDPAEDGGAEQGGRRAAPWRVG